MVQSCARADGPAALSRVSATARRPGRRAGVLCAAAAGRARALVTRIVHAVLSVLLPAALPGRSVSAGHGVRLAQPRGSSVASSAAGTLRYAMARRGPPGAIHRP